MSKEHLTTRQQLFVLTSAFLMAVAGCIGYIEVDSTPTPCLKTPTPSSTPDITPTPTPTYLPPAPSL